MADQADELSRQAKAGEAGQLSWPLPLIRTSETGFSGEPANADAARIFGGQFLAQAVDVAAHSVDAGMVAHALSAQFFKPGNPLTAISYEVEKLRDTRNFSSRMVRVFQDGSLLNVNMLSFVRAGTALVAGPEVSLRRPEVAPPSEQDDIGVWLERQPMLRPLFNGGRHPMEIRLTHIPQPGTLPARTGYWFRPSVGVPDIASAKASFLAYVSDRLIMTTLKLAMAEHGDFAVVTLNHDLRFHRPVALNGWLFFEANAVLAKAGRSFCRAEIYGGDGSHLGSISQEGLLN